MEGGTAGRLHILVAGEAQDSNEALALARRPDVNILLLDLSMRGNSGIELVRRIHRDAPRLGILILTMHDERHYAERAMRAGALGYLTKQHAAVDLPHAIREAAPPHATLSDRELQVFTQLASGDSLSVIADRLCLSVKTISTHKARIMAKMGAAQSCGNGAVRNIEKPASAKALRMNPYALADVLDAKLRKVGRR